MTNEEIIATIRNEVERLMDEYKPIVGGVDELTGAHIVLAKLLSFLSTLPGQPVENPKKGVPKYPLSVIADLLGSTPPEPVVFIPEKTVEPKEVEQ